MKKQTSLLAILLACLSMSAWAASSIVNVKVGSADANPSLVFGQDAEAKQVAAPPFSGMFGVKDLYLANTENIGELNVTGDMERLGTDIRASVADDDCWVLMAGADAKLYFGIANEGVTPEYEVVYDLTDGAESAVREAIADGSALSVKAGGIYKFYQKGTVEQEPVSKRDIKATQFTVVLTKDEDEESPTKGFYVGYGESENRSKTTKTFYADVVTTDAPVYIAVVREGEGEVYDYYKSGDESAVQITKDETADGWLLTCRYPKSTQMTVNYVCDRFTLTVPEEDESDTDFIGFEAVAQKGSFVPITTTFHNNDDTKIATISWTIKNAGTIDYDGDGDVDGNDAMYLYNYVNAGRGEKTTTRNLNKFLYEATDAEVQTALDTMLGNMNALDLDGDGDVDGNDAMYLYNYVNAGRGDKTTTRNLNKFLYEATEAEIQTALENILNYAP